jgi:hypothetical protein
MHMLREHLYATYRCVVSAILITRWVVLRMGAAVHSVNCRQQNAIHLQLEVLIVDLTVRLPRPIQLGEEKIQQDVLQADNTAEGVVRHLVHRSVHLMMHALRVEIRHENWTEVEIGLQVGHCHLRRRPSYPPHRDGQTARECYDTVHVKSYTCSARYPLVLI